MESGFAPADPLRSGRLGLCFSILGLGLAVCGVTAARSATAGLKVAALFSAAEAPAAGEAGVESTFCILGALSIFIDTIFLNTLSVSPEVF